MAFDLSMPILVVDDYNTMIRIIRNLLKQSASKTSMMPVDDRPPLAKMQGKKYGLVISDWNMEPMTGYDLLREVRASPELSQTPFIMITRRSKTENVIAAKKAGSELHRQAVQRRYVEDQDGSGVSRLGRVTCCERYRTLSRAASNWATRSVVSLFRRSRSRRASEQIPPLEFF